MLFATIRTPLMRLVIALFLCVCLHAQPERSPYSGSTDPKQDKSRITNNEKPPDGNQPPAAPPPREAHPKPAQTGEDVEANRQIAHYTEALAHYTLVLVFVGVLQGIFLWKAFYQNSYRTNP